MQISTKASRANISSREDSLVTPEPSKARLCAGNRQ